MNSKGENTGQFAAYSDDKPCSVQGAIIQIGAVTVVVGGVLTIIGGFMLGSSKIPLGVSLLVVGLVIAIVGIVVCAIRPKLQKKAEVLPQQDRKPSVVKIHQWKGSNISVRRELD